MTELFVFYCQLYLKTVRHISYDHYYEHGFTTVN